MSNNPYNLATPLAENPYFTAFVRVVREELEKIDPEKLLVYMFDTVDASLLDILAEQFDMLGYNGWILATTDAQKRELLKDSARLHDLQGHPAGIREVALRLGFKDVIIEENTGAPEGAENPWAYFKVKYVLADDRAIDLATPAHLVNMIDVYKGMRNILSDFSLVLQPEDVTSLKGEVYTKVTRISTGEVLSEDTITNRLSITSVKILLDNTRYIGPLSYDVTGNYMIRDIAFGTNGTYQATEFTVTNSTRKILNDNPSPPAGEADTIQYAKSAVPGGGSFNERRGMQHFFELGSSEGNGKTLREIVLYAVDRVELNPEPDVIFARVVRSPIVKTSDIKIEGHWTVWLYPNTSPE